MTAPGRSLKDIEEKQEGLEREEAVKKQGDSKGGRERERERG